MLAATTSRRRARPPAAAAFTLVELLLVVAIIAMLAAILAPCLAAAKRATRKAVCAANLHHLQLAFRMYLEDNEGKFFPYQVKTPEGALWYWGLERPGGGGVEGRRVLDKSRARLGRYLPHTGGMETCPSLPYGRGDFKQKFDTPSYGYGINRCMLDGANRGVDFDGITQPASTVAWADCIQINTWQAPASPTRPMLEEWYYLDNRTATGATFHFRHNLQCGAAFADGSVRSLSPDWLDSRCDGVVGRPEPPVPPSQVTPLLRLDK